MMYQLPIDMMTRIPNVILATRSPPFHRASRPYGFSTNSVVLALSAFAAGATGAAVGVLVAAGGSAGAETAGAEGCACASAINGVAPAVTAMSKAVANAATRVIFRMLPPNG